MVNTPAKQVYKHDCFQALELKVLSRNGYGLYHVFFIRKHNNIAAARAVDREFLNLVFSGNFVWWVSGRWVARVSQPTPTDSPSLQPVGG